MQTFKLQILIINSLKNKTKIKNESKMQNGALKKP